MRDEQEYHWLVVHILASRYEVYIGRAMPRYGLRNSPWRNPFKLHNPHPLDRARVLRKYATYLLNERNDLLEQAGELRGKVLGCWCRVNQPALPYVCHGDILTRLADLDTVEERRIWLENYLHTTKPDTGNVAD